MRLRGTAALALVCISLGWFVFVRQRAAGVEQKLATLRMEIDSINDASLALAANRVGASATVGQGGIEPEVARPGQAQNTPVLSHANDLMVADSAHYVGLGAGIATGRRGECSSHPVVFWHYPKTGPYTPSILQPGSCNFYSNRANIC